MIAGCYSRIHNINGLACELTFLSMLAKAYKYAYTILIYDHLVTYWYTVSTSVWHNSLSLIKIIIMLNVGLD